MLVALIVLSLKDFEFDNIRPVLGDGVVPVLKGIKTSFIAYSGFEIMLIFTAFMKEPQKAVKSMMLGISVVIILYTLVVLISFGTLTVEEVKTVTWPTMTVAKNIELPGEFFERFESLFSVLWVLSMYTAFVPFQYVASFGLGQVLKKDYRIFVYATLPVIYIVAIYPRDLNSVFKLGDFIGYLALFTIIIMPLIFWVILMLRGKSVESS
ncbi:GerAB/ArcD/ProY family transporter [Paenibacillus sp. N3.4]|nr:GerAB/ArcD/ProY family transporter [Paenibacillus sp. N3.4]